MSRSLCLERGRLCVDSGLRGFPDGVVFLKVTAQGEHRCGVDLTDARFGDAENFGDLMQAEVLEVIEGKHLRCTSGRCFRRPTMMLAISPRAVE